MNCWGWMFGSELERVWGTKRYIQASCQHDGGWLQLLVTI